ncbi:hypothetical protein [Methylopila sp. 73B]|uniref:hypothetical protein n=1 Tax=Methylopila sp. 73B TaxID=1120792 RepID=UPI0012DECC5F|nr:hypothetical protein [Methylopila sp. 73B]
MSDLTSPLTKNVIAKDNKFEAIVGGAHVIKGYSFFRGEHTNFGPELNQIDQPDGLIKFVLNGLLPAAPFITANDKIVAFGSFFADNISNYLNNIWLKVLTKIDKIAYVSKLGDGIVNTFALRHQFEWTWNNFIPKSAL